MKYLALFALATVVNYSCGSKATVFKPTKDTVLVVANNVGDNKFMDSAIRITRRVFVAKDSGSTSGEWQTVTLYSLGQRTDTLRDSLKRPLLDQFHNPIVHFTYSPQALDTSNNKFIQVIDLPSNPLPIIKH